MELWDAPVWTSAYRHNVAEADMRHVLRNFFAVADDPRDDDVTLFLGSDRSGRLVEVGVLDTDDGPAIIHAMAGRVERFFPTRG